jgi:hypothetical protein
MNLGKNSNMNNAGKQPGVTIVTGRCSKTKGLYGMRFEKMADSWMGTWAFAIEDTKVKKEGYDKNDIDGTFGFTEEFPGCPYCSRKNMVHCSCGNNTCWDGETKKVTCPWCGQVGQIEGIVETLHSGGDR